MIDIVDSKATERCTLQSRSDGLARLQSLKISAKYFLLTNLLGRFLMKHNIFKEQL